MRTTNSANKVHIIQRQNISAHMSEEQISQDLMVEAARKQHVPTPAGEGGTPQNI